MNTTKTAKRFVEAVASRDHDGIVGALSPEVRFRYLIPPGPGQVIGATSAAATYLDWFGDADPLEVQELMVREVSDRVSARYRFRVRRDKRWEVIEQQTFLDVDAGLIAAIDLVCSGFRPTEDPDGVGHAQRHEFDAGAMGCSDGLASEFRRRIGAIPVGDLLVVTARDPAAKEDLPPLARMMGHEVRSIEAPGDGLLVITVEKGQR